MGDASPAADTGRALSPVLQRCFAGFMLAFTVFLGGALALIVAGLVRLGISHGHLYLTGGQMLAWEILFGAGTGFGTAGLVTGAFLFGEQRRKMATRRAARQALFRDMAGDLGALQRRGEDGTDG